ncbi:Na+/H+ antiporter subunit E [Streptomyces spiroverticillatus]|uniref:Na+/H+ antiporter subunit E n=1 Tax=Streptomyces finlayi TaxID=67296 RepID=A0A918WU50_9ACTN|nr:Na+/H+ antiporter subunit E [Streptomyces finlayi]GGZ98077.1 Na+/H+ antiporter subunit E [Streptomyces spiroverticillatus]GHC83048.1 Na+/H+ antiporter subunit E [Streptomyces finlayi]
MSDDQPVPCGRRGRIDLPLIAWLTVIWMLLWSGATWGNLISGVVVAVVLCVLFPLPPVELGLRLRPLGILLLAKYLLHDIIAASHKVALLAWSGRVGPAAVVRVPLRCRTDLMLAATAVAVSSVPGGALIEVNAVTATLYLHVSDADDPENVARTRASVWRLERLVVRAFGTRDELERVRQEPPSVERDSLGDAP